MFLEQELILFYEYSEQYLMAESTSRLRMNVTALQERENVFGS